MPQFTIVASTTRLWRVDERLRRWFVPYEFGPYTPADIALILAALGRDHHLIITDGAARELAAYCKGTPGNALVLVRRLATECIDLVRPELTASGALKALSLLGYGRSYPQSLRLFDQLSSMSGIEFEHGSPTSFALRDGIPSRLLRQAITESTWLFTGAAQNLLYSAKDGSIRSGNQWSVTCTAHC